MVVHAGQLSRIQKHINRVKNMTVNLRSYLDTHFLSYLTICKSLTWRVFFIRKKWKLIIESFIKIRYGVIWRPVAFEVSATIVHYWKLIRHRVINDTIFHMCNRAIELYEFFDKVGFLCKNSHVQQQLFLVTITQVYFTIVFLTCSKSKYRNLWESFTSDYVQLIIEVNLSRLALISH